MTVQPNYTYEALVERIVDGDTVILTVRVGFYILSERQKFRLNGINAPELPSPEGQAAKAALAEFLKIPGVVIQSHKGSAALDRYNRWLAMIWAMDDKGVQFNVNQAMLDNGFAKKYG